MKNSVGVGGVQNCQSGCYRKLPFMAPIKGGIRQGAESIEAWCIWALATSPVSKQEAVVKLHGRMERKVLTGDATHRLIVVDHRQRLVSVRKTPRKPVAENEVY